MTVSSSPSLRYVLFCLCALALSSGVACSANTSQAHSEPGGPSSSDASARPETGSGSGGPLIEIQPNSPADTVRSFYTKLREGRIREAIHLTNLRPAIEGLTDDELKEFSVDFEAIAKKVPTEIRINGEIISGDRATVTALLPSEPGEDPELQELNLRREGEYWIIISADEESEKLIKRDGKAYFYKLKIETHQEEAKKMLERVAKAQIAFAAQNQGSFATLAELVEIGYVPADVSSSESTGYVYALHLGEGRKTYFATATPAVYGKTGRNSYILEPREQGLPLVTGRDNNGAPLRK
ncbi:MAG TPA: hypothetical protein PKD24_00745 [Pyrinomonadaceae bacterium]|nr:hypothetical protein [Pyrinomonadaceae bacterium]HMP64316.1 hypothetical protein [Pyrinomonadaceae bacterium]